MTNPAFPKPNNPGWTACRVLSRRAHRVRDELEQAGIGTFTPTYASTRYVGGKRSSSERQLMPGYLFVCGVAPEVDGLLGCVGRVTEAEMARLTLGHALRWHDQIEAAPEVERRRRVRRRRPRPGKRRLAHHEGAEI